jgi:hypothetical protein
MTTYYCRTTFDVDDLTVVGDGGHCWKEVKKTFEIFALKVLRVRCDFFHIKICPKQLLLRMTFDLTATVLVTFLL